jgi:septum site-determining protein MinD
MAVSPSDMILVCDQLRQEMDYVVIDSPAGIERGFRNAIAPADQVLIVTNPEVSAVRDADRIIGLIEAEEKGPGKLVVNRLKPEMVARGDMISVEDILDILAIDLIGVIPEDESILISTNQGLPVVMTGANGSSASQAFSNVAARITGRETAFLDLTPKGSLLERMRGWMSGR